MTRRISTSHLIGLAVATLLAGCQSATQTAVPSLDSTIGSPAATLPSRTSEPTAAAPASPEPSAVPCPIALPTTLPVDALADPACYGTTELTIHGWLADTSIYIDHGEPTPSWVNSFSGLFAASPTAGAFVVDFLFADPTFPRVHVVTPPGSAIDLSTVGRWVTLQGHFNDPEAMTCAVTPNPEYPNDIPEDLECERLFVVTALASLERPAPACPTGSPITIATFMSADATCFRDRTFKLSGWEDAGEGFGGVAPVFSVSLGTLRLAESQLVPNRWEADLAMVPIFPWTVAGSGIAFDRSDRQVVVTATLGGAAARSCAPNDSAWTWAPPDSWAQHRCEHLLVITGVRDR